MNRHSLTLVCIASATLGSLAAGYFLGNRRGEAAVEAQRAALSNARSLENRALPQMARRGGHGTAEPNAKPRTRAEVAKFLADLKMRTPASAGPSGNLRPGMDDPAAEAALEALSLDDVRTAMDLANEMPPGLERTGLSMALMRRWAREDPMGALGYFESHRDEAGPFGTLWLASVLMPWIETDAPTAAREFARVLHNEHDDILQGSISNAVWMVAEKLRSSDPAGALGYVGSLPEWARESARSAVSKEVHGHGRDAFLNCLRTLPEGPDKTAWQLAAASAMAPVDAPAATRWIDSLGLSEAARHETIRSVFDNWSAHDPRAAVEWAGARLPESEKPGLLAQTVERWAAREPNECGRWLGELPVGPDLDPSLAAFARAVASKDADSASAWADQITDPERRAACQREIKKLTQRE